MTDPEQTYEKASVVIDASPSVHRIYLGSGAAEAAAEFAKKHNDAETGFGLGWDAVSDVPVYRTS